MHLEKQMRYLIINYETDIDKMFSYAKNPYESKYQLLFNKGESTGLKYLNDSKTFMEYSNDMNDVYKCIEEYNRTKNKTRRKTETKKYWLYLMIWLLICLVIKYLIHK